VTISRKESCDRTVSAQICAKDDRCDKYLRWLSARRNELAQTTVIFGTKLLTRLGPSIYTSEGTKGALWWYHGKVKWQSTFGECRPPAPPFASASSWHGAATARRAVGNCNLPQAQVGLPQRHTAVGSSFRRPRSHSHIETLQRARPTPVWNGSALTYRRHTSAAPSACVLLQ